MSLSQTLKPAFGSTDRNRGRQYFQTGEVGDLRIHDGFMIAEVNGSWDEFYEVTVDVDDFGNEAALSCTCPRFAGGHNCKHIWAAILEYDSQFTGKISRRDNNNGARKKKITRVVSKKGSSKRTERPEWQKLLQPVSINNTDRFRDIQSPFESAAVQQSEIHYVIDAASGSPCHDAALILTVMHRVRKKDGNWGKLKPIKLEHEMISSIADARDRRIAKALMGADRDYGDSYGYGYHSIRTGFSDFEISSDWSAELCNALCESGRFYWTLDDRAPIDEMHVIKSIDFESPAQIPLTAC